MSPGVVNLTHRDRLPPRRLLAGATLVAALCIATGAAVLLGWLRESPSLVRGFTSGPPMQFNNALCFLLQGAALLAGLRGRTRAAWCAAGLAAALAGTTLAEHLLARDLGIDRFFIEPFTRTDAPAPGRMGLMTTLCHLLTACSLAVLAAPRPRKWAGVLLGIGSSAITPISAVVLFAYSIGSAEAVSWVRQVSMAVPTAGLFFALGVSVQALTWSRRSEVGLASRAWIPCQAGLTVLTGTLVLWSAMLAQESTRTRERTRVEAESLGNMLEVRLRSRLALLQRQADFAARSGLPSREVWEFEAERMLRDFPGFQALCWVDGASRVRWASPAEGNAPVLDRDLSREPPLASALFRARAEGGLTLTEPVPLWTGGTGYWACAPILGDGDAGGFIAGVFEPGAMLTAILEPWLAPDHAVRVSDADILVYRHGEPAGGSAAAASFSAAVDARSWKVEVAPTAANRELHRSVLPALTLAGGTGLALLLALLVLFAETARARQAATEAARRQLEVESAERQQAQEATRRSESRLQALLDHSPAVIFLRDVHGRLLLVNTRFEQVFGRSRQEFLGQSFYPLLPPDLAGEHRQHDLEVLSGSSARQFEEVLPAGGERRTYLSHKFPIYDLEEAPIALCAISTDITDRKRIEDALRTATDRLARSNADLERFAYVASHDLQEPLRMVSSYVQLLARRYQGSLDAEAHEFIAYAVDGAQRMQGLIQDLLAYSRVGSRDIVAAEAELSEVVATARANLRMAIEESAAVIECGPLPRMRVDRRQFEQLFQNLLGNAIKFRGDRPPRIEISAREEGGEWTLSVRDHGIGLDPRYAERIFEVFQRLHTRAEYPGTGIGLAICKRIVERHGGRISVESRPGEGAAFHITLHKAEVAHDEVLAGA